MSDLNKSIDNMIDELFAENDPVEKSIDIAKDAKTTADEVANKAPKGEDDKKRKDGGRPDEVSDVPKTDKDGNRAKGYDSIQAKQKEDEPSETKQSKTTDQTKGDSKGSEMPKIYKSLSEEEFAEYQELKKAKEEAAKEEMKKAFLAEQKDLIKSAVKEATAGIVAENEALKKSLDEQGELIKAMANKPQRRKSIDNIQALEKSGEASSEAKPEAFSKSEMLNKAEELALNKSIHGFNDNHVIELENSGYIYDENARTILENELKKTK